MLWTGRLSSEIRGDRVSILVTKERGQYRAPTPTRHDVWSRREAKGTHVLDVDDDVRVPVDAFGETWTERVGRRLAGAGTALFVSWFLLLLLAGSADAGLAVLMTSFVYGVGLPISFLLERWLRPRYRSHPAVAVHGLAGAAIAVLYVVAWAGWQPRLGAAILIVVGLGSLVGAVAAWVGLNLRGSSALAAAVGGPALVLLTLLT